jgi:hypothetical protein
MNNYITIKGRQYSTSMISLDPSKMKLTDADIEPLKDMTCLTELWLEYNQINDISALSGTKLMGNYIKMPYGKIIDTSYLTSKLQLGHIIYKILVNERTQRITELTSYAIDREEKSYYKALLPVEPLEDCVIVEHMLPYYTFDHEKTNGCTADIDIDADEQDIISLYDFGGSLLGDAPNRYYDGGTFTFSEAYNDASWSDEPFHLEVYLSKDHGNIDDIANFGGPLELKFVETWMTDMGLLDQ